MEQYSYGGIKNGLERIYKLGNKAENYGRNKEGVFTYSLMVREMKELKKFKRRVVFTTEQ